MRSGAGAGPAPGCGGGSRPRASCVARVGMGRPQVSLRSFTPRQLSRSVSICQSQRQVNAPRTSPTLPRPRLRLLEALALLHRGHHPPQQRLQLPAPLAGPLQLAPLLLELRLKRAGDAARGGRRRGGGGGRVGGAARWGEWVGVGRGRGAPPPLLALGGLGVGGVEDPLREAGLRLLARARAAQQGGQGPAWAAGR